MTLAASAHPSNGLPTVVAVPDEYKGPSYTVPYAGETEARYRTLSDLGLAPRIICVQDMMITTVYHPTLRDWIDQDQPEDDVLVMAKRIRDLLRRVHEEAGICYRDVHIDNIVLYDGQPLLIGPKWAAPSVNDRCYDLEGPDPSGVELPEPHKGKTHNGVWWGSSEKTRSLLSAFGPPPVD